MGFGVFGDLVGRGVLISVGFGALVGFGVGGLISKLADTEKLEAIPDVLKKFETILGIQLFDVNNPCCHIR